MTMNLTDPFKRGPARIAALPRVVRVYIAGCVAGYALSAVFTALIIGGNVANIGHLVTTVEGGWLAALVFFMFNGIVFSGVQTGIVIMSVAETDDETPPRGTPEVLEARPVYVPADPYGRAPRRDG